MCPMTLKELIGSKEAAHLLGVTRCTINRWAKAGKLNPAGELGKRGIYVFDRSELERLAAESKEARVD